MKLCISCQNVKNFTQFPHSKKSVDGCFPYCKDCNNKRVKTWRTNYPEKAKETARKDNLKSSYGISLEKYNELFTTQDGKCAICKKHQSELTKALAVDHCHTTKKVRGLLCTNCNIGVGNLQDNEEILRAALEYLKYNREKNGTESI